VNKVIAIYKNRTETPLQALARVRGWGGGEYTDATLSYAGRLDPMAEGVMLVLVGEENKNREKYLGLDKTYVTEILFGFSTDTADILGKISASQKSLKFVKSGEIEIELKKMLGKFAQKYPAYSSKSFAGSYEDVRDGKVSEILHDVEMYSAELLDVTEISAKNVLKKVTEDISKVVGDFRQEEIIKIWQENLKDEPHVFQIAKMRLEVSSGFYVRQFAEDLGEKVGLPALAFSIVREQVGEWRIDSCLL
jgi:tRNA pseudouridine55 synthase